MVPEVEAVHAVFAAPAEVVAERRSLYRLAAELLGVPGEVPDDVLDSPLVRYRLGGALAGHFDLAGVDLAGDRDAVGEVVDVGLPLVADPAARQALATLFGIVGPVPGLRLITKADEVFGEVVEIVAEGVLLARKAGGALAEDLLTHVDLVAVVDPATAGGLVSASSRYFPGVVVIERPTTAVQVAEALIHEGAHDKFFDLAITREFLDSRSDMAEEFRPSWSRARWPMEQVFAAWHAYQCLAQFARADLPTGPGSLLPFAAERAAEIGKWLRDHEEYLLADARTMLDAVLGTGASSPCGIISAEPTTASGHFVKNPHVRLGGVNPTGRRVVGRDGSPPALFWLSNDSTSVLDFFVGHADGKSAEDGFAAVQALWNVDADEARKRWTSAFDALCSKWIVLPAS
ncbi:aKG-HExxH-type peptide beta-hydroxylase [Umezawaea sp. Da 62-37]|uniref:aKG-HExxH-type peptide beta-hydroxylase n=1 Tax=Umezawaea sp. Da 62-37 TaxID=3075927 RepID=UPI0028F7467E|nr:HEXXH motif-containing putative peptide modification protein [Umezawaea sp. Da 62-37]WNV82716.1 HEXXH motif-containing putative peptide modification protein [Umezawaea sp. Da 62-37]